MTSVRDEWMNCTLCIFYTRLLRLYVLHCLSFCFFVCLFSFGFNYQFSFTRSCHATLLQTRSESFPLFFFSSVSLFSFPVSVRLSQHRKKKNTSENTSHHRPKSSNRTNVKSGVSALSSTSNAFGTAASNARLEQTGNGHIDEALRQQALAEEEAAMNQYKVLRYCRLAVYIGVSKSKRRQFCRRAVKFDCDINANISTFIYAYMCSTLS